MKHVIVLVGPKGAGKSTIGDLLEKRLGIPFVRVEPIFLATREALGPGHPDYERRGFEAVLARLAAELARADTICFESTGASSHFAWLLGELGRVAAVLPVQVLVEASECLDRIRTRDASIHIPVSDDQVARVNALAFQVQLPWAAQIDNRGPFAPDAIVRQVHDLLQKARVMAVIREILPHEYSKARDIDVTESGNCIYRMVDGQLVEQPLEWQRPQWSEDRVQKLIACWTRAAADGGAVLGAFAGDRLVGEAVFRPRLTAEMAQLESLHVSAGYRRQGLARALVSEVIRRARESGHRALYVSATESRSAVGFYRSMGFVPTATPHPRLLELEPADIHMTLAL